jgi:Domain of unknown function (DUF397)
MRQNMEFGHALWRTSSFSTDQTSCVEIAFPDWRKSSFSGTETSCVEIAYPDWHKSSFSTETADCVEIAYPAAEALVGIRDSKDPAGGHLTIPATALHHLTRTISDAL